jgi:hypothetical protein
MDAGSRSLLSLVEKRTDLVENIYAGADLEVPGRLAFYLGQQELECRGPAAFA